METYVLDGEKSGGRGPRGAFCSRIDVLRLVKLDCGLPVLKEDTDEFVRAAVTSLVELLFWNRFRALPSATTGVSIPDCSVSCGCPPKGKMGLVNIPPDGVSSFRVFSVDLDEML
jgi:hypothetical protein